MDLNVSDLSCARGGLPVVEGVNFDVPEGEALILRGPNGSGKTTLLRTIAGLQPALTGRMTVDRDDVAYAGHADAVKTTLTVRENLAFWNDVHGGPGLEAALGAFDLVGLADRPAMQLSAGQRRRLGLARLLVTGRRVWALDEPTVSLDAASVDLFIAAVRAHLDAGGIGLVATHIDLGLGAPVLEVARFRARLSVDEFDAAFL